MKPLYILTVWLQSVAIALLIGGGIVLHEYKCPCETNPSKGAVKIDSVMVHDTIKIHAAPISYYITAARIDKRDRAQINSQGIETELLKTDWVIKERIKNESESIKTLVSVVSNLDDVYVQKTQDDNTWTIQINDNKNNSATIWLDKNDKVRAVTPY